MLEPVLRKLHLFCLTACAAVLLAGCQSPTAPVETPSITVNLSSPSITPTPTPPHYPTATQTLTPPLPTASLTPTGTPVPTICSPLEGVSLADLPVMIVNPYHPPPLGSDDPHQGIDLAQVQDGVAISGLPVQAVLDGVVVLVTADRFPYGNALLIETPLDSLPPAWLEGLDLPEAPATPQVRSALTCPTPQAPLTGDSQGRSLYLLYAHMRDAPSISPGDSISCGQALGEIGASGNALNPHLHLEARLGPGGAAFSGMAHYDPSASPDEMASYCRWRVSGDFLSFDPLQLFYAFP